MLEFEKSSPWGINHANKRSHVELCDTDLAVLVLIRMNNELNLLVIFECSMQRIGDGNTTNPVQSAKNKEYLGACGLKGSATLH